MIKREHIKQAIDAISRRDPKIGYTLDEMLAMGRIDTLPPDEAPEHDGDFHLLFDNKLVTIRRFTFFSEGTVSIEQRLLIKYGEMIKRQQLLKKGEKIAYRDAVREFRLSGVRLMVTHEMDYAITRLRKGEIKPGIGFIPTPDQSRSAESVQDTSEVKRRLIARLESIKRDKLPLKISATAMNTDMCSTVLYQASVNHDTPAYFIQFPFSMDTLMQVADINLEYFQVRFLLDCLIRGTEKYLFACVIENKIEGLVYLTLRQRYFYRALEIRYIATVHSVAADHLAYRPRTLKGVGTFLIAGVWLLWKTALARARDILLDSEIGSRGFYNGIGFRSRGFSEYRLKAPEGHLAKAVVDMANHRRELKQNVIEEIQALIQKQVRLLCKRSSNERIKSVKKLAIDTIKACLQSGAHPEFSHTATQALLKCRKKIVESDELFRFAREFGSDETKLMLHHVIYSEPGKSKK